jgi:hypothetical protein
MPYQRVPNSDLTYALIIFDESGHERSEDPEGGIFSRALLERVRTEQPNHVFLFSHGWKGDVPAAVDQYNRWHWRHVEPRGRPDQRGKWVPSAVYRTALA